ncbi:hypothetical protein CCACVL1_16496 [Corchorus capsularis]|uniref:Uncharacterized protein n=1 Tax=Corchorus capsularis TaxID=210143 RepID=A0A1R3HWJ4_COCAP|nr:hypothetical protein CCACVL1_16496 [Corchorus capsularis]
MTLHTTERAESKFAEDYNFPTIKGGFQIIKPGRKPKHLDND